MKLLTATLAALTLTVASPAPASATPPPPPMGATDCANRVYVINDLVCASPELMALDRQVAEAAAKVPDAVRPEWPRMLIGQNDWYWRSRQCFKERDQKACLEAAYRDRLVELEVLGAPPAAGAGQAARCEGPPWAGGRDAFVNRAAGGSLVVSDPSGQVLAVGLKPNRAGWKAFMTLEGDKAPWRLRHYQGAAIIVCTPS